MGHGCVVNQWVELLVNQWVGLLACSGMAMHAISARGHVAWHCGEPLGLEWAWLCDLQWAWLYLPWAWPHMWPICGFGYMAVGVAVFDNGRGCVIQP